MENITQPKNIDKLPELCGNLELVSIYNIDGCSTQELLYKISLKVNEVVREVNKFEVVVSTDLDNINSKVEDLLSKGLYNEVLKVLNEWLDNGQLGEVIQDSLSEINTEIANTKKTLSELAVEVMKLASYQTVNLMVYTTSELSTIVAPKTGSMVYDSTRGKAILYKNGQWVNLDGSAL